MNSDILISDGTTDYSIDSGGKPHGVWVESWSAPLLSKQNTYAESPTSRGRRRIRTKHENGTGTLTLGIAAEDGASFWTMLDELQAMLEAVHRNRGTLVQEVGAEWQTLTWHVESVELKGWPNDGRSLRNFTTELTVEIECLPGARGEKIQSVASTTLDEPVSEMVVSDVPGHLEAFVDLTLTESDGVARRFIEVCIEDDYDPDDPAPLSLSLPDLVTSGFAGASDTLSGSHATNVVLATLSTSPQVICSSGAIAGKGLKKVRVRVYPSDRGTFVRCIWRVGDAPFVAERWVEVPLAGDFCDLDLGVLDIRVVDPESHSYEVRIESYAATAGDTLALDILYPLPADKYLRLRDPDAPRTPEVFVVSDDFNQSAGPLDTKMPDLGPAWSTSSGGNDFQVAGGSVSRTDPNGIDKSGYFVVDLARIWVQADVGLLASNEPDYVAVWARGGSALLRLVSYSGTLYVQVRVGAAVVAQISEAELPLIANGAVTLALFVSEIGTWEAYVEKQHPEPSLDRPVLSGYDSDLATGGSKESGSVGVLHGNAGSGSTTAYLDRVRMWVPFADGVLLGSQRINVTHEQVLRESEADDVWGRPPMVDGHYLTVPPSALSGEQSRIAIRVRRLDVDSGKPDIGLTDGSAATIDIIPRFTRYGGVG